MTLLELLTVLTILGILVAIGIPSFAYLSSNTRLKTATTNVYLGLLKARAEAVKRNDTVVVARSGTNWEEGWRVCLTACPASLTDTTNVLVVQDAITAVAIRGVGGDALPAAITYVGSGRLNLTDIEGRVRFNIAPAPRNASEAIPLAQARCVSVQANGSPVLKEAACT